MKFLIAPDSFKESISAGEAALAMARGVRRVAADAAIDLCPVGDGGEGTLEALLAATGGRVLMRSVVGPLGETVEARWGMLGDGVTAVIEMAQAAGLALVPHERRDPMLTTTFGVGQLMAGALEAGAKKLIIAIGGSATNDGGAGMAQALGAKFTLQTGPAAAPLTGGMLREIRAIDASEIKAKLAGVRVVAACDVTNPLTGPEGASAIFGPQKGATAEQVRLLDDGLAHLARVCRAAGLGAADDADRPGAGAAGGLGFGLGAFCGGRLERGIELVLEAVGFRRRLEDVSLVITGEGKMDGQSTRGKACAGVAAAAKAAGVPTVAIVGSLGTGWEKMIDLGLTAAISLCDGTGSIQQAMREAARLIEQAAMQITRRHQTGEFSGGRKREGNGGAMERPGA